MNAASASREAVAPAYLTVPDHVSSAGAEAAAFMREVVGMPLDPEQELLLDAMLAETSPGRWAARNVGIVMPRQNGKSLALEARALVGAYLFGEPLIIWTAALYATAAESMRHMQQLVSASPELWDLTDRILTGAGQQAIELKNGGRIIFRARSSDSGRGLTADVVILDEAYDVTPEELAALNPTTTTIANAQMIYASSAGMADSDVLRNLRDAGRAGRGERLAWVEWCAEGVCATTDCAHALGTEGCLFDDRSAWRRANPALGRRISEDTVAAERAVMPVPLFARERLGWWDEPGAGGVQPFTADQWAACRVDAGTPQAPHVGVAVDPDLAWATVAVAGTCDGRTLAEVVQHAPGVAWVPGVLAALRERLGTAAVAVDVKGPAAVPLPDWIRDGVDPRGPKDARDYAGACGRLADDVRAGRFAHLGQAPLDEAVTAATPKSYADLWVWRRGSGLLSTCALEAVTLACWSLTEQPDPLSFVH